MQKLSLIPFNCLLSRSARRKRGTRERREEHEGISIRCPVYCGSCCVHCSVYHWTTRSALMYNLYSIEQSILKMLYDGKTFDEVSASLNLSQEDLDTCMRTIRRKTGADTWMDLLRVGKRLTEASTEAPPAKEEPEEPEITPERADRIHQMISARFLEQNLSDEDRWYTEYLQIGRASCRERVRMCMQAVY